MTQVRAAQAEDRVGLLMLCKLLHEENGAHTIYWPNVELAVDRCISKQGGVVGLIGPVGDPVGAIMLHLDRIWYSNEHQLLEILNFVHKDHRRSDYAKSLIKYAIEMSETLEIDLMIGVLSHIRMQPKIRLYQRLVPQAGAFFVHHPASKAEVIAAE